MDLALIKHLLLSIILLWLLIVTFPSFAAWTNHYKWGSSNNVSNFNKTSFNKDLDLDISTQEKTSYLVELHKIIFTKASELSGVINGPTTLLNCTCVDRNNCLVKNITCIIIILPHLLSGQRCCDSR